MREKAREAILRRNKKSKPFYEKYAYHIVIGVFVAIILYGLVSTLWRGGPNIATTFVNDEALITQRNTGDSTFKVGPIAAFQDLKLSEVKHLFNTQATNKQQLYKCASSEKASIISEKYNFREIHPECARPIYSQGNCSASYSIAAISAINDRFCLQNKAEHPVLSAQTPIACDKAINSQCKGGFVSRTLDYSKIYGLVDEACLPYDVSKIDKSFDCAVKIKECQKYKISDYCVSSTEEGIKQEIFNHGPIIAVIPVYRDFLIYKEGLYQVYPKNQRFPSGHAIKIIGWDVQAGQNCWIIENSWGEDWGVNGTACVLVNQEEIGMERFALAPSLVAPEKEGDEEEGTEEKESIELDENSAPQDQGEQAENVNVPNEEVEL